MAKPYQTRYGLGQDGNLPTEEPNHENRENIMGECVQLTPDHYGGTTTCEELFNCCDCGERDNYCGCAYCWSCNACEECFEGEE